MCFKSFWISDSVDPDQMLNLQHLIRVYTVNSGLTSNILGKYGIKINNCLISL